GFGQLGIFFNSGHALEVYDSTFTNLGATGAGVLAFRTTSDPAHLLVENCRFVNIGGLGVSGMAPNGSLRLAVSNSRFQTIGAGISVSSNVHAEIHDTDVFHA